MPAKILALSIQASLAVVAWYLSRPDDERRRLQAAGWQAIERWAMQAAKSASSCAAWAETRRKETIST